MAELTEKIEQAKRFITAKYSDSPRVGIILGSGLGALINSLEIKAEIPYDEIPHFVKSTVEFHAGKLIFGRLSGQSVVAMQGRFHYYEGYSMEEITFPVRVMKALGIETLIVSNACGGLNPGFTPGDLMVITDHINLLGNNPLIGPNDARLGDRFPDMYNCYDMDLVKLAEQVALDLKFPLKKGVTPWRRKRFRLKQN